MQYDIYKMNRIKFKVKSLVLSVKTEKYWPIFLTMPQINQQTIIFSPLIKTSLAW